MRSEGSGRRYEELDALRGVAALMVVFNHHLQVFPSVTSVDWGTTGIGIGKILRVTPFYLLWDGGAAVTLFFVLSGFVLSLPFYSGRQPTYVPYLIKRVCRIYLPYLAAIVCSIALAESIPKSPLTGLSGWVQLHWTVPGTWRLIVAHLLLVPDFESTAYDAVIWSLVHEMRISIIFPLLMVVVLRLRWFMAIGVALSVWVVGMVLAITIPGSTVSFPNTLVAIYPFVVGAVLAKNREPLIAAYQRAPATMRLLWLVLALCLWNYAGFLPWMTLIHRNLLGASVPVIGAVMLIVGVLGSNVVGSVLRRPLAVYLGKISYSLYLLHLIVLLALLHLTYPRFPLAFLLPCSVALGLLTAGAMYRWVELPSIALGRSLAKTWESRKPLTQANLELGRREVLNETTS